ncbi:GSCFA domain-containing protein [Prevotella stercorea]|uniref:GSCFA domain-containing protein n=1 Tax=Leyella stercorea TaxID=363265 RepID=UPI001F2B7B2B|nr:GSCFA domain-containing protein [Leyella stercorea]MCF2645556.1 GSCFA domain-containing protein [Leyella stercorea]
MEFRTPVTITLAPFAIEPRERMLFVGSCFADNIGRRFVDDKFRATVNPYGVMYNPASILHTVKRWTGELVAAQSEASDSGSDVSQAINEAPQTAVFTLGTNHVYVLNETGEIVDNCRRRPQRLFTERELSVDECADYLRDAVTMLRQINPSVRIIITVSPIRYAKYGFHGSQLSKATLLLAADKLTKEMNNVVYFPAYEIVNDELRDYRFYREDMLHPTDQAVEYIWQCFGETFFSKQTVKFLEEWRPIKAALAHRPFNPEAEEYKKFLEKAKEGERELMERYK